MNSEKKHSRLWNIPLEDPVESQWTTKDLWTSLSSLRGDINISNEKRSVFTLIELLCVSRLGRKEETGAEISVLAHFPEQYIWTEVIYLKEHQRVPEKSEKDRQEQTPNWGHMKTVIRDGSRDGQIQNIPGPLRTHLSILCLVAPLLTHFKGGPCTKVNQYDLGFVWVYWPEKQKNERACFHPRGARQWSKLARLKA